MLCDKCHEREANIFLTRITNGVMERTNFCPACGEASGFLAGSGAEPWVADGKCHYCGADHAADIFGHIARMLGEPKSSLCDACGKEFLRFLFQEMQPALKPPTKKEELAALRAAYSKADGHMKQWAAENRRLSS